jgi:hypothetical protein
VNASKREKEKGGEEEEEVGVEPICSASCCLTRLSLAKKLMNSLVLDVASEGVILGSCVENQGNNQSVKTQDFGDWKGKESPVSRKILLPTCTLRLTNENQDLQRECMHSDVSKLYSRTIKAQWHYSPYR